ncbi:MAG: hypothetical protein IJ009_00925 [Clostridia bacterium]|nr:hypothetical protein [Clostridia bacterium]MBQ8859661.1 hypothetical protein [Clostridia bacterium]
MLRQKPTLYVALALFFVAEAVLGLALQLAEGRAVACLSYGAVLLACLFCTAFARRTSRYILTQLALILTLGADYFLVLAPKRQQLPAMLFFSAVQICYFLRLYLADKSKMRRRIHLLCRVVLSLAMLAVTLGVLGEGADALALVSMFYYANLVLNLVFALLAGKGQRRLAAGLFFFFLCDTVIGLSLVGNYLPIAADFPLYIVLFPGFNLAWAFYVPAKFLLSVSAWESDGKGG